MEVFTSPTAIKTLDETVANLQQKGFPNADTDHVFLKTDTSEKQTCRDRVLYDHEVVLLGDNLSDFSQVFDGQSTAVRGQFAASLKRSLRPVHRPAQCHVRRLGVQRHLRRQPRLDRCAEGLIAFSEDPVAKRTVNIGGGIYTRASQARKSKKSRGAFRSASTLPLKPRAPVQRIVTAHAKG